MITNLISFLYDIEVETIRKSNDNYIFYYDNAFYIFKKTKISEEYVTYIYKFINNNNVLYHNIVKNRHNRYISNYNNDNYILMMVKFNLNRMLLLEDIYESSTQRISYIKKKEFNWITLWKMKIDQIEYFVNNSNVQFDIYNLSIINYYLGLAEIAIGLLNNINIDYIPLSLCHNRIYINSDLYEYYSVTDLIFDHFTRDMGEYIKNYIYSSIPIDLGRFEIVNNLNMNDKYMLLSRILFPTLFFDIFDDFVLNNRDFKYFYRQFANMTLYERNLKLVIDYLMK